MSDSAANPDALAKAAAKKAAKESEKAAKLASESCGLRVAGWRLTRVHTELKAKEEKRAQEAELKAVRQREKKKGKKKK